ncbi:MAG: hypothetical protein V4671_21085, partial [Armatimonadota bacterium]
MTDFDDLPETPIWENHTTNGLYTIDRVIETPSNSEENAVEMFLVNRTSVRGRNSSHEVRYYRTQPLAEAAALQHDQTGAWPTDGEILRCPWHG